MIKSNSTPTDTRVTIDGKFIRDQARDAVHQFFRPITDPFKAVGGKKDDKAPEPSRARR